VSATDGVRLGIFHAVSTITTTGFVTADIQTWTALAMAVAAAMMFIGGSAGSTGGSVKVVRHLLIARLVRREVRYTVQPELAEPIRLNRSVVDERTLRSVSTFGLLYIGTFVIGAGVLALDAAVQGPSLTAIDVMTAAAGALGTVGSGTVAGGGGSVTGYSDVSTLTLTLLMWLGRLELLPVLAAFTRGYWRL
jgi:trk system potassium uptake protein TrkH